MEAKGPPQGHQGRGEQEMALDSGIGVGSTRTYSKPSRGLRMACRRVRVVGERRLSGGVPTWVPTLVLPISPEPPVSCLERPRSPRRISPEQCSTHGESESE